MFLKLVVACKLDVLLVVSKRHNSKGEEFEEVEEVIKPIYVMAIIMTRMRMKNLMSMKCNGSH